MRDLCVMHRYVESFSCLCSIKDRQKSARLIQIMTTKDNMLTSISKEIEQEFGKPGTPERAKFDEETYAFYTGQLLSDARKEAKVTQAELARRLHATRSYIARVERGDIMPSAAMFYNMISALGLRIEIVKPVATI